MPYLSERNVFVCQQFLSFFVLFSNIKTNKIQLKVGFQRMKQTVHNFIAHWLSLETTQHLIISLIAFWDSSLVNVFIYFHMLRYHFYSMRTKVISVSRNYWTAMTGSLFFLFWYTCFWWRHAVFYSVRNRRLIVLARQILFSWSMSCLGSFEPTVWASLIFPFRFVWGDRRKRSRAMMTWPERTESSLIIIVK